MSRPRGDRARIVAAQREGTRQRLISLGIAPERVADLVAAFDALAERQGQPWDGEAAYWFALTNRRRTPPR